MQRIITKVLTLLRNPNHFWVKLLVHYIKLGRTHTLVNVLSLSSADLMASFADSIELKAHRTLADDPIDKFTVKKLRAGEGSLLAAILCCQCCTPVTVACLRRLLAPSRSKVGTANSGPLREALTGTTSSAVNDDVARSSLS